MNDNMRKFVRGLMVSTVSKGVLPKKGEPVAYLYNGVRLPALPEWDREKYPYAYICGDKTNGRYSLNFSATQKSVNQNGVTLFIEATIRYILSDGKWERGTLAVNYPVIWSNTDVYYFDSVETVGGTLYLAASDPVPVYE